MMRHARVGGFSLLETIAAMFLLAVCFGALMRAASASMSLTTRATSYTQASLWASGLMDRVFVADFPTEGVHSGTFDAVYRWTMRISSPPAEATTRMSVPIHLYRVELTVEWNEGGKPLSARYTTLRTVSEVPPRSSAPVGAEP